MTRRAPMSTNPGEEFERVKRVRRQVGAEVLDMVEALGAAAWKLPQCDPAQVKAVVAFIADQIIGRYTLNKEE